MKRALMTGVLVMFIQAHASAQSGPAPDVADSTSRAQRSAMSQRRLDQYMKGRSAAPLENRKTLDEIHALGLPKTAANVAAIRAMLNSKVSNEEKIELARILATLFYPADPTGMNFAILQDLRSVARSREDDVARAATLAYSRLGYFPDTQEILSAARSRGMIDEDEHMGELAHVTPFAPAGDQSGLVAQIRRSGNKYGIEVLIYVLQMKEIRTNLTPQAKAQVLLLLDEQEPNFPPELGYYGYTDAFRFTQWLHLRALLVSELKGTSYRDVVMAKLDEDRTDPRKIMSFLGAEEGKQLMKEVGRRAPFEKMQGRISLYSRQLPQNLGMREMVASANASLAALKP